MNIVHIRCWEHIAHTLDHPCSEEEKTISASFKDLLVSRASDVQRCTNVWTRWNL